MWMSIHGIPVCGVAIDAQTRCAHYHSELDRIAIKFKCCQAYYACYQCHEAAADHAAQVWPRREFTEQAILCGACGEAMKVSSEQAPRYQPWSKRLDVWTVGAKQASENLTLRD